MPCHVNAGTDKLGRSVAGMDGMTDDLFMDIKPGDRVLARTATHDWVPLLATSVVERGQDFPILWLRPEGAGTEDAFAWPADAVRTYEGTAP